MGRVTRVGFGRARGRPLLRLSQPWGWHRVVAWSCPCICESAWTLVVRFVCVHLLDATMSVPCRAGVPAVPTPVPALRAAEGCGVS